MNLLRFYLTVGATEFRAEDFSIDSEKMGLSQSSFKSINLKVNPRFPGVKKENFLSWKAETIYFSKSEEDFASRNAISKSVDDNFAPDWAIENNAVIEYVIRTTAQMPAIKDYCDGDYFFFIKLIYSEDEDGNPPPCPIYSSELIKILGERGIGIESDTEPAGMQFSYIKKYPEVLI